MEYAEAFNIYEEKMPSGYKSISPAIVGTAPSSDPEVAYRETRKYAPQFMWRLSVEGDDKLYTSFKPISVNLHRNGNFYFATNDSLNICGNGNSIQEAIDDLASHIVYYFHYYGDLRDDQLTGDAIRLKHLYANLLVEEHCAS